MKCIKFQLPDGHVVDILSNVIENMFLWKQTDSGIPESGGYIMGYQEIKTKNITLSSMTAPQKNDIRTRFYCMLKDVAHKTFLSLQAERKNYYMGVWHTHPQAIPSPSGIDWDDWYKTLHEDKMGCAYAFFIIIGTEDFRVWVGRFDNYSINEIYECESLDGIYIKKE